MEHKRMENIWARCDSIAFLALCILMSYCVVCGTGVFLARGGLSLWRVCLAVFLLTAIPGMIRKMREIFRNPYLWVLLVFAGWMCISAVIGVRSGNDRSMIVRDIKSMIYFVFFPALLAVLQSKKRVHILMKCMMYATFALSVFNCVFIFLYLCAPGAFGVVRDIFYRAEFLNFTAISTRIPRILYVSAPFQLCGCAFACYFQMVEKKLSVRYMVITAFELFCIMMTFTRALYMATVVTAVLVIGLAIYCVEHSRRKRALWQVTAAALICSVLICGFSAVAQTNYLKYAAQRAILGISGGEMGGPVLEDETDMLSAEESSTDEMEEIPEFDDVESYRKATMVSDAIRGRIKKELLTLIHAAPILGNGLGTVLKERTSVPEYFFLDVWARMGLIGLVLYLLPTVLQAILVGRNVLWHRRMLLSCVWLAVLLGLMTYAIFQPYMNNAPCILFYCCSLCVNAMEHQTIKENEPLHT